MLMNKQQILNALSPDWWSTSLASDWRSQYAGVQINFLNTGGNEMTYLSSAPYQSNGINSAPSNIDLSVLIEDLMQDCAQTLENQHCAQVLGYTPLTKVYTGQSWS